MSIGCRITYYYCINAGCSRLRLSRPRGVIRSSSGDDRNRDGARECKCLRALRGFLRVAWYVLNAPEFSSGGDGAHEEPRYVE